MLAQEAELAVTSNGETSLRVSQQLTQECHSHAVSQYLMYVLHMLQRNLQPCTDQL